MSPFSHKNRLMSNFTTFNPYRPAKTTSTGGFDGGSTTSRMTMMPIQNEVVRNVYFASK